MPSFFSSLSHFLSHFLPSASAIMVPSFFSSSFFLSLSHFLQSATVSSFLGSLSHFFSHFLPSPSAKARGEMNRAAQNVVNSNFMVVFSSLVIILIKTPKGSSLTRYTVGNFIQKKNQPIQARNSWFPSIPEILAGMTPFQVLPCSSVTNLRIFSTARSRSSSSLTIPPFPMSSLSSSN